VISRRGMLVRSGLGVVAGAVGAFAATLFPEFASRRGPIAEWSGRQRGR
jgi:hypothetical protein